MNWMLFTISNEPIKESLDKLQTKVESLETVKEVQDKIISAKDSQISFLNDQIANIWTPITIVAGLIALVISYVAWVNKRADQKIKQGEEQLNLAQEKIDQAENKIQQANTITTIAQEKLAELEEKQKLLEEQANAIDTKQKLDMKFNYIKKDLEFLYKRQETDRRFCLPDQKEEFNDFTYKTGELEAKYISLFSNLSNTIFRDIEITDDDIQQVEKLTIDVQEFMNDYISFYLNLRLRRDEN